MDFVAFFKEASRGHSPYPYQQQLGEGAWPETRIVPTGFGKTAAVLSAWLWKTSRQDPDTPPRLVYCLPMRTLVEQTEAIAQRWIAAAKEYLGLGVQIDVLMGGHGEGRRSLPSWMLKPERPAILIGTQDLLVSAALMRGYGASRYRWPVDFALLHNDALWVFDEVQLAGAALTTSAQLEAFRREFKTDRPSRTLWMSATLDPSWLKTVDFKPKDERRPHDLSPEDVDRARHLWAARKVLKPIDLSTADVHKKDGLRSYAVALAKVARNRSRPNTNTILFLNTVARAQAVFAALAQADAGPERLLIHSRFRAADRKVRTDRLRAELPAEGRIVVTTQALEAGVDVTSSVLITEIAPWSSLVQRFGRCNRGGECGEAGAEVFWIDLPDDAARPYEARELADARSKLASLSTCGPADLAAIPPSAPARGHVIRKRDLLDLFDTDPDLSGFDVDVSLYVRDANDTDVRFFWRPVYGDAPAESASDPSRDELCPAPIGGGKELLKRKGVRAWRWDGLAREWRFVEADDMFPGLTIWIDAACGGYDPERGFDPAATKPVEPIAELATEPPSEEGDTGTRTTKVRVSVAKHVVHVRDAAAGLAKEFGLGEADRDLIVETALWHDLGKVHPAFVLRVGNADVPLAKSPDFKARPAGKRQDTRPYFRHELASTLAYLTRRGWSEEASLAAYLIAAHHGKVRMRLRARPDEVNPGNGRLFARGVWQGDVLPAARLGELEVPETVLDLDIMQLGESETCGSSWSARTQRLLKEHGPFRLAWLEALVRIADWRGSSAEEEAGHDDL